jgi:hypothetical protein
MPGTYSITSRASGSLLTAAIYNEDHQAHLTFNTPGGCDDYSVNLAQMQSTVDPGESGSESLPTDLAGEIQRLRNIIKEITGKTFWYESPASSLASISSLALITAFDYSVVAGSPGRMPLPTRYRQGFIYNPNASDPSNDLDFSIGACRDDGDTHNIIQTTFSPLTKQTDAAWAVGQNAGSLDTGAVGNNEYWIFAIKRTDTGVCDILTSLSPSAPTMPTNYTKKRLIGWFKRVGGVIVAFHNIAIANGFRLMWDVPTLDVNQTNTLTTSRRTDAIKVPNTVTVLAHITVTMLDAAIWLARVCSTNETDAAPSVTAAPLANVRGNVAAQYVSVSLDVYAVAGIIAARAGTATIDQYNVQTDGFTWVSKDDTM